MQPISILKNCLYFVPVIGTIHHARELYKLDQEEAELEKIVPSIKELNTMLNIRAKIDKIIKVFDELKALSDLDKNKVSDYFAKRKLTANLGFYGSVVQVIIWIAARCLYGARTESFHLAYSFYKLLQNMTTYYHYDRKTGNETFCSESMNGIDGIC